MARRLDEAGNTSLHVNLPAGGRQVVLILDGSPGYDHGLSLTTGSGGTRMAPGRGGGCSAPKNGCPWMLLEPGRISATVGGRKVVDWRGSFKRLGLMDRHAVPRKDVPFLGTIDSRFEFKDIAIHRF